MSAKTETTAPAPTQHSRVDFGYPQIDPVSSSLYLRSVAGVVFAVAVLGAFFFRGPGDEGSGLVIYSTALVLSAMVAIVFAWKRELPPRVHPVDWGVGLACAWTVIAALWHPALHLQFIAWINVGGFAIAYGAARLLGPNESAWRVTVPLITAIALANAAWSIYSSLVLGRPSGAQFIDRNNLSAFLNLLLFVVMAWYVLRAQGSPHNRLVFWGAVIACCVLVLGSLATASRGGALGLICAGMLATSLLWTTFPRNQRSWLLACTILGVVVVAVVLTIASAAVSGNQETVLLRTLRYGFSVRGQLVGRNEIWEPSWRLFLDLPWHGAGLGMYWLRFPPYRLPSDISTGFHAHNDYLELAIEGGWPAVALVLSLAIAATGLLWRVVFAQFTPVRTAAILLYCGLSAVAIHSVFNFNLYAMPLPWLTGFALAQFVSLGAGNRIARPLRAGARVAWKSGLGIGALALGLLGGYGIAAGLGGTHHQMAETAYRQNRYEQALMSLRSAQAWSPLDDSLFIAEADVLVKQLVQEPGGDAAGRIRLARGALDRAERLNQFRPYAHLLRGHLLRLDKTVDPVSQILLAESEYRRAITLDPYFNEGRLALTRLLLDTNRSRDATQITTRALAEARMSADDRLEFLVLASHAYIRAGMVKEALESAKAVEMLPAGKGFLLRFRLQYGL